MLVTISATYGAGGSIVAPAVATALGVPFADRLIRSDVVTTFSETTPADEVVDNVIGRILFRFAQMSEDFDPERIVDQDAAARERLESYLQSLQTEAGAVVLGWAGVAILDRALHVRLDGNPECRILQAMNLEDISESLARERQRQIDRARARFVRRLYRIDARDPSLYHLVIDSTEIPLASVAQAIVAAARGFDCGVV
jgi:cytidylate kinase